MNGTKFPVPNDSTYYGSTVTYVFVFVLWCPKLHVSVFGMRGENVCFFSNMVLTYSFLDEIWSNAGNFPFLHAVLGHDNAWTIAPLPFSAEKNLFAKNLRIRGWNLLHMGPKKETRSTQNTIRNANASTPTLYSAQKKKLYAKNFKIYSKSTYQLRARTYSVINFNELKLYSVHSLFHEIF